MMARYVKHPEDVTVIAFSMLQLLSCALYCQHFTIILWVYFSDLVNLCTVEGNKGDGNAQGDCLSLDEVCNADGTCTLGGII